MSKITKELVLLASLLLIAGMFQIYAQSLPMALCFYFLPTLYSAYFFGRRHATLTAFACVFVVVLLGFVNTLMPSHRVLNLPGERLFNFLIWAGILAVTGYAMGTLYERAQGMTDDIRESFGGLLLILQHYLATEKHTSAENQRVIETSVEIAEVMGLGSDRVELMRSAVLLRNLSEVGISNDILYKAADMSQEEMAANIRKGRKIDTRSQAVGNSVRRVLPIMVAEQILQGQGARSVNVPLEAHILAVADTYERLLSGRDGAALTPGQAQERILLGGGEKFNAGVVEAFGKAMVLKARAAGAS